MAGYTLVQTQTASSDTSLDFDVSAYDRVLFTFTDIVPGTDNTNLEMRFSQDGGSSFLAGTNYTWYHLIGLQSGNTDFDATADDKINLINILGTAANETAFGKVEIFNLKDIAGFTHASIELMAHASNSSFYSRHGDGFLSSNTSDVTDVRFFMSSGNIASGTIKLYGWAD